MEDEQVSGEGQEASRRFLGLGGGPGDGDEGGDADGSPKGASDQGASGEHEDVPEDLKLSGLDDEEDGGDGKGEEGKVPFHKHPRWQQLQTRYKETRTDLSASKRELKGLTKERDTLKGDLDGFLELYSGSDLDPLDAARIDSQIANLLDEMAESGDREAQQVADRIAAKLDRGRGLRQQAGRGRGAARSSGRQASSSRGDEGGDDAPYRDAAEVLVETVLDANGVTRFKKQLAREALDQMDLSKRPTRTAVRDAVQEAFTVLDLDPKDAIGGKRQSRRTPSTGGRGRAAIGSRGRQAQRGGGEGGQGGGGGKEPAKPGTAHEAAEARRKSFLSGLRDKVASSQ